MIGVLVVNVVSAAAIVVITAGVEHRPTTAARWLRFAHLSTGHLELVLLLRVDMPQHLNYASHAYMTLADLQPFKHHSLCSHLV
jgi:hypothetical protein